MKYYKLDALQVKVECGSPSGIPHKLGYANYQELQDANYIDELGISEITKEEYEVTDDYYERY